MEAGIASCVSSHRDARQEVAFAWSGECLVREFDA